MFVPPSPPGSHDPGEAGTLSRRTARAEDGQGNGMAKAAIAVQENRAGEPDQLELRFFAIVDGFARRPPERALWRVLIDTALAKVDVFTARGGRRISAEAVHHVALAFYMQADAAGVIHEFSEEFIGEQCRMSKRNVHAARQVLNDLRVVRSIPARGRRPGVHRMNLGGLDWPAVRQRVARTRRGDMVSPQSGPGDGRRGDMVSGQDGRRGDMVSPLMGCTTELPLSVAAGRYPSRARADRQQEQQQHRDQVRLEGLLGAIASRARRLGHDFDEAGERRRIADGEIDIAALQALADDLDAELAEQGDVRRHRITPGLDGGGRCTVCGRRAPSETELCPGRPRRSRIQALAEDCADAETRTGSARPTARSDG